MHWSWSPVGNYQSHYPFRECAKWAGKQSSNWIYAEGMTSPAHTQLVADNLVFLIVLTNILRDKGNPMLGDKPIGQRSVLHILSFLYMWKESVRSGWQCFPLSPQGLVDVDPGWVHRLESALQLFVCRTPSTAPLQAMWVGQTDFLTQGFIVGEQGERAPGYASRKLDKPCSFLFFITKAVCHSWWQAQEIVRCPSPECCRGTALSHHVIISQGVETQKKRRGNPPQRERSRFNRTLIMWGNIRI